MSSISNPPLHPSILLLNPNSSESMTLGILEAAEKMHLPQSHGIMSRIHLSAYTAPPSSPRSINDGSDLELSTEVVYNDIKSKTLLSAHDAILVACFSVHPLVKALSSLSTNNKPIITGIFESSILTCLSLLSPTGKWGIVTTGQFWEFHLTSGVNSFLGITDPHASNAKFAGVESTGLNASDFHGGVSQEEIRHRLREATRRLLRKGNIECVVMGCAGMAGLEEIIREVAQEEYGEKGKEVCVVDGVRAGVSVLEQAVRSRRAFRGVGG